MSNLKPLGEAVLEVTGLSPHPSTLIRWCQKPNKQGVRLRNRIVGAKRLTTSDWVRQYIDETSRLSDLAKESRSAKTN